MSVSLTEVHLDTDTLGDLQDMPSREYTLTPVANLNIYISVN